MNPKFSDITDQELRQVLNSFTIHHGELSKCYRPDHDYSDSAPVITKDMYPSIFQAYREEAKRRNIVATPIFALTSDIILKMVEGDYQLSRDSDGKLRLYYGDEIMEVSDDVELYFTW